MCSWFVDTLKHDSFSMLLLYVSNRFVHYRLCMLLSLSHKPLMHSTLNEWFVWSWISLQSCAVSIFGTLTFSIEYVVPHLWLSYCRYEWFWKIWIMEHCMLVSDAVLIMHQFRVDDCHRKEWHCKNVVTHNERRNRPGFSTAKSWSGICAWFYAYLSCLISLLNVYRIYFVMILVHYKLSM